MIHAQNGYGNYFRLLLAGIVFISSTVVLQAEPLKHYKPKEPLYLGTFTSSDCTTLQENNSGKNDRVLAVTINLGTSDQIQEIIGAYLQQQNIIPESDKALYIRMPAPLFKGIFTTQVLHEGELFTVVIGSHVIIGKNAGIFCKPFLGCDPGNQLDMRIECPVESAPPLTYKRIACFAVEGTHPHAFAPVVFHQQTLHNPLVQQQITAYIDNVTNHNDFRQYYSSEVDTSLFMLETNILYYVSPEQSDELLISYCCTILDRGGDGFSGLLHYNRKNNLIEDIYPIQFSEYLPCFSEEYITAAHVSSDAHTDYLVDFYYYEGSSLNLLIYDPETGRYSRFFSTGYSGL